MNRNLQAAGLPAGGFTWGTSPARGRCGPALRSVRSICAELDRRRRTRRPAGCGACCAQVELLASSQGELAVGQPWTWRGNRARCGQSRTHLICTDTVLLGRPKLPIPALGVRPGLSFTALTCRSTCLKFPQRSRYWVPADHLLTTARQQHRGRPARRAGSWLQCRTASRLLYIAHAARRAGPTAARRS